MDVLPNILKLVEVQYDYEYTEKLNALIRERFASKVDRSGTHVSDLLYCLRKAWGKHHVPEAEWREQDPEDDPILMWGQGLQFEDLVAEGERVRPSAYCFDCKTVSSVPAVLPGEKEVERCTVCGKRWLIGTPDWKVDGLIHESKQTRKSQRRGPADAPWWLEQVVTYMLFEHRRGNTEVTSKWARLVVNWLMGDYGEKRKGMRPRGPKSALDAFKLVFVGEFGDWEGELHRRKMVVEGPEMPPLTGMQLDARSPAYPWECASCPVGKAIGCELWRWDDEDKEMTDASRGSLPDPASAELRGPGDQQSPEPAPAQG